MLWREHAWVGSDLEFDYLAFGLSILLVVHILCLVLKYLLITSEWIQ